MAAKFEGEPTPFEVDLHLTEEGGEWMCSLTTQDVDGSVKLGDDGIEVVLDQLAPGGSSYKIVFRCPEGWLFFQDVAIVWAQPPQESQEPMVFGTAPIAASADRTTCALPVQLAPDQKPFSYTFFFVLRNLQGTVTIADPTIVTQPPPD